MAITYPTTLDSFTDKVDNVDDVQAVDINDVQDACEALEAKVGVNSSAVATTIDYLLKSTSSANPGHKHTLVNSATDVTATAAEINTACDGATAKNSHTHVPGASTIGQGELKTSQQTITQGGGQTVTSLTGGEYCFKNTESRAAALLSAGGVFPSAGQAVQNAVDNQYYWLPYIGTSLAEASYITLFSSTAAVWTAKVRYVTASGELHWIFILYDKQGNIQCIHEAPDHPTMGNRGIEHPFASYDPTKHNIVVINPSMEQVEMIQANCLPAEGGGWMTKEKSLLGVQEDYLKPTRPFMESFLDLYEIQESQKADWPDTPVTIALPKMHNGRIIHDWRFMPQFDSDGKPVKISPIKRVIPKPNYITPLKIKEKS